MLAKRKAQAKARADYRAICDAFSESLQGDQEKVLDMCAVGADVVDEVYQLAGTPNAGEIEIKEDADDAAGDNDKKRRDAKKAVGVFLLNSFATPGARVLFPIAARVNHSCAPNLTKHYEGFRAIVTTLREVEEGEELMISYLGEEVDKSTSERRARLKAKYNFDCCCTMCEPER